MPDLDRRRLAAEGASRLQELLPQEWDFRITPFDPGNQGLDLQVTVQSPQGVYNELLVEARSRVTPLAAREIGAERRRVKTWARGPQATHVVVAPWLSRSTQQILREGEVGYLDLTGNVYLRISNPAVFVRTDGAARDPNPGPADERRALSGVKAGRLVRVLVDSAPPARPTELARAIELSLPYVGRLLTALEEQGLIRWGRRGVDEVDWQALLRTRAEQSAPLLRPGTGVTLLAPRGVDRLLDTVRDQLPDQLLITGFYAAAAITPIAVGGQLLLYPVGPVLGHPEALAVRLEDVGGLLPTDRGADVVVLTPADPPVVRWGAEHVDGTWRAAPSQLVLDSLTGNGRMPAEGEAVLEWMADNEAEWRAGSLDELVAGRYFRG